MTGMNQYDVIVVGLGAMGSATTYQLAKSGARVLGIDRYSPPHTFGSTHGDTRLTRRATGEGAAYVPLVTRSLELWREIEQATGYELLRQCGGLLMCAPGRKSRHGSEDFVSRTINFAAQYGIDHENLSAKEIRTRFPQFNLGGDEIGYLEPEAGYLIPETCVKAQLELANRFGAAVHLNEQVLSFSDNNGLVTVKTDKASYSTKKLIISAGPWINELLPELEGMFKVYRQVLYWFDLRDHSQYDAYHDMPVFAWKFGSGDEDFVYGFPAIDGPRGGLKIASEKYDAPTTPSEVVRDVSPDEIKQMYEKIRDQFPGLSERCIKTATCMYTETPDHKFVIDYHPNSKNIIVASPCSGHGFKHSAAIGETLAQLATTGKTTIDIAPFSMQRLRAGL
jgi:sarcosine oxidase